MSKYRFFAFFAPLRRYFSAFSDFLTFLGKFIKSKLISFSLSFEKYKNILVKFFMMKRGRYIRPFLHMSTIGALTLGVIVAPFLASTYPVFSQNSTTSSQITASSQGQSIVVGENVFQTDISQKPRDKVITYTVQKGDTISTIAQKFGISDSTIKWENDLTDDSISVGDTLSILPVTGIAYKVQSGDTIYTIAKKFDTEAEKIVNYPFNDFANPETFSLVTGQMLIVPDGVKPSEQPIIRKQVYIAQGPVSVSSAGFTWPLRGLITQNPTWYHMGLDIAAPTGTPVVAAKGGTVIEALGSGWNWGWGLTIVIDNGDGYKTRYSHLNSLNVAVGDTVAGGSTVIGFVGNTGRSTGPHLDFRIIRNGVELNPFSYLQ